MDSIGQVGATEKEEQSVASLVYENFRPRVNKPKHVAYLFPEGYHLSKAETMEEKRERRRRQIFNRRDSARISTRSEGSGVKGQPLGIRRMGSNRSVKSLASNHSNDSVNGSLIENTGLSRQRSSSVPTLITNSTDVPSRLQMRRSSNAYLEVMWPRFFGSNRDSFRDSVSLSSQSTFDDQPGSMDAVMEEADCDVVDNNVFSTSGDASEDDVTSIEEEVCAPVDLMLRTKDGASAPSRSDMFQGHTSSPELVLPKDDIGFSKEVTTFDVNGTVSSSSNVCRTLEPEPGQAISRESPKTGSRKKESRGRRDRLKKQTSSTDYEDTGGSGADDNLIIKKYDDVTTYLMWEEARSETSATDQLIPNPWHSRYSDSSLDSLEVTIPTRAQPSNCADVSFDSDDTIPDEFIMVALEGMGNVSGDLKGAQKVVPKEVPELKHDDVEAAVVASATGHAIMVRGKRNEVERDVSIAEGSSYSTGCNDVVDRLQEKWTLIESGEHVGSKKKYGTTNSVEIPECPERKKSEKSEKLKRTFKICCFPFTLNW